MHCCNVVSLLVSEHTCAGKYIHKAQKVTRDGVHVSAIVVANADRFPDVLAELSNVVFKVLYLHGA
jgi:hypothetical protein